MVKSTKFPLFIICFLFVIFLADFAMTEESEISEVTITDIAALKGKWIGSLTNGPSNALTIKADGSWTNVVVGNTYIGTAFIKGDTIEAESKTTGLVYHWHVYEGNGRRTLKWVEIRSGKVVATDKFSPTE